MKLHSLSHHAYLLVGTNSLRAELIKSLEKDHGITARANPDFFDRTYMTFTIDDARELKSAALMRPTGESGKKIFALSMNGITVEAQNALLKLLEEPPEYAVFFLILPSAHLLLPTVKSRLSFIDVSSHKAENVSGERYTKDDITAAEKFVSSAPSKRLDIIKSLIDDISKEKKSRQDAIDFLNAVESTIYSNEGSKKGRTKLEAIQMIRTYLNDRAPSVKMLMEYVALNI